jgi:hypothetical protein
MPENVWKITSPAVPGRFGKQSFLRDANCGRWRLGEASHARKSLLGRLGSIPEEQGVATTAATWTGGTTWSGQLIVCTRSVLGRKARMSNDISSGKYKYQ